MITLRLWAYALAALLLLNVGCKENEITGTVTQQVRFGFLLQTAGGRIRADEEPAFVKLNFKDPEDKEAPADTQLPLTAFGGSYITGESITLPVGNYSLTKFIVLNAAGKAIYAAPVAGSETANLVTAPLPIPFEVKVNETTTVSPEVVWIAESQSPADFGYAAFALNIVRPVITSLSDSVLTAGDVIEITGSHFSASGNVVRFYAPNAGAAAVKPLERTLEVLSQNSTSIRFRVPDNFAAEVGIHHAAFISILSPDYGKSLNSSTVKVWHNNTPLIINRPWHVSGFAGSETLVMEASGRVHYVVEKDHGTPVPHEGTWTIDHLGRLILTCFYPSEIRYEFPILWIYRTTDAQGNAVISFRVLHPTWGYVDMLAI